MTNQSVPAGVSIHGLNLVNLSMDDSIAAIEGALSARETTRISFVNADCVNIASVNHAYRRALASSDWTFIDGIGMRIAGLVLNQPVRDNVNGTDLFPRLCQSLAQHGQRLYLLGGRPGIAEATADWARSRYPGLQIAGSQHGYYPADTEAAIISAIHASHADVLLVGMGAPRQELWLERHMAACGVTVALGVGGLFDFYSGRIPRAPLWMRKLGLEWLFRLLQEPGRMWRRYLLGNIEFLLRIAGDWLSGWLHRMDQLKSGRSGGGQ